MKLLVSNQHGAVVMALLPFLYGMLLAQPIWLHFFLLVAWFNLYLMTYPFLNLFKGRNLELYKKWTLIYASTTILFALPALWHNWKILYFVVAILPFAAVNMYYSKQKNERAFINDIAAIIIFSIAGMAAYYFPLQQWDDKIWWVAIYPALFFVGTTLAVKSVLRERKNPRYLHASLAYHLLLIILLIACQQYLVALSFVPACLRAFALPKLNVSVKQVGLLEMVVSLLFFVILLMATI